MWEKNVDSYLKGNNLIDKTDTTLPKYKTNYCFYTNLNVYKGIKETYLMTNNCLSMKPLHMKCICISL